MNKVLILGSGMIARPLVEYLMERNYRVVIASPVRRSAEEMIGGNPLGAFVDWSMDDRETLELLVAGNDITVSLLPYQYHPEVARVCLRNNRHLVTTSYVKEEMMGFDEAARNSGLIFLNETGLDPGIDHMSAMEIIDLVHSGGGKVVEFYSLCGALPAPESADNPLRYKFSWSPKGVVLATMNSALYMKNGKQVLVQSEDLFNDVFTYGIEGFGELEVYPNRDSLGYIDIYGIPAVSTMYRGTLRYRGWCEAVNAMKKLGMLDSAVKDFSGKTYAEFISEITGEPRDNIIQRVSERLKTTPVSDAVRALEYLGFFSNEKLKYYETSPFEITSDRMIEKMMLKPGERDVVILDHIVLAEAPGGKKEIIRSSLVAFGTQPVTAVSRTVALPAAIAVRLILEGRIVSRGVLRPVIPEIYQPVLKELRSLGIEMKMERKPWDSTTPLFP